MSSSSEFDLLLGVAAVVHPSLAPLMRAKQSMDSAESEQCNDKSDMESVSRRRVVAMLAGEMTATKIEIEFGLDVSMPRLQQ